QELLLRDFRIARCQEDVDPEREKQWVELFNELDLNSDGVIDIHELRVGLAKRGLSRRAVDRRRKGSATKVHNSKCW
uniref:EF-hand domain-containing protein n=1 Tax=Salmo trutta TaxID=8032 RepID=A0A673WPZ8_SALTR